MIASAAILMALAAVVLVLPSAVAARRLTAATWGTRASPGRAGGRRTRTVPPVLACGVAASAAALVVGGPLGLILGIAVVLGGPQVLGRLEPGQVRAERRRLVADLPGSLDLLSACLAGGAETGRAASAVARAVGGPCGARLDAVSAALAVGTAATDAWRRLSGDDPDDPLAAVARLLSRAAEGGAPVAATIARLADDARSDSRSVAEQAARRVGVLVVAPLGLCFLPAFVLLGVVPVILGLAGPVLAGL